MCCSFPPNVTCSTFLQQLALSPLAEQFTSSGSVYILHSCRRFAKQAVNYCGCSTFPVINISANHGQSRVRNTEAVKGGQFCSVFVIYLQYIRADLVRALHCGVLHNKILCFLCLYRVFKKTSPNSKVQNFVIVALYPRRRLLFPRFLLITLSVPAHSSLFIWGGETLWIT